MQGRAMYLSCTSLMTLLYRSGGYLGEESGGGGYVSEDRAKVVSVTHLSPDCWPGRDTLLRTYHPARLVYRMHPDPSDRSFAE